MINLTASTQSSTLAAEGYGALDISDLSTAYSSLTNLFFGVAGTGPGINEVLLGTAGTNKPFPASNQGPIYITLAGLSNGWQVAPSFPGEGTASDSSDVIETSGLEGTYQKAAGSERTYSYTPFDSFATYSSSGTETLNLYDLKQGASAPVNLGAFTLDSAGDLTFTTPAAAPEPSTYALFGLGGLAMIIALRRRNALMA